MKFINFPSKDLLKISNAYENIGIHFNIIGILPNGNIVCLLDNIWFEALYKIKDILKYFDNYYNNHYFEDISYDEDTQYWSENQVSLKIKCKKCPVELRFTLENDSTMDQKIIFACNFYFPDNYHIFVIDKCERMTNMKAFF